MPLASPRIDHVVINVLGALDDAAERYRRLGFHLTERGHHTLGTSNHLAIFGTDYLELLGFEPGNEARRPDLVRYPAGLSGLVLKPPADPGFDGTLRAMGVPADPPQEFSRPVDGPEGPGDARFRTMNVPGAVANGRLFFCHHHTPELVWQDRWRHHPNGVVGITGFTIAAADPARTAELFERLLGPGTAIEGGLRFTLGTATLTLATPEVLARTYGDAVPRQADGADRMVALAFRTASLDAARAAFDAGSIADVTETDGTLLVPAAAACGVALLFSA